MGKKIAIIGSGFIGNSLGKYYHDNGFNVTFYDISESTLSDLKSKGYKVNDSFKEVIEDSKYIFITLPTPTINGKINLIAFNETVEKIINIDNLNDKIFIIKSTITPKTTEELFIKKLINNGKKANQDFGVIYSPEFITEIAKTWDKKGEEISFGTEDRVVIGEGDNNKWGNLFIEDLILNKDIPVVRTSYKEAEMIKYVSNTMLATKISFWNEIFLLSQKLEMNFEDIAKGVSLDKRIGKYGTVTGKAFGGKCLPKDLDAFIGFSEEFREMDILKSVKDINDMMMSEFGVRE